MKDTYQTIEAPVAGIFKDRGSKFLAYAEEVENDDDIKGFLDRVKKEHPKARHHCYAFRLGLDGNRYRANDDGEPSGTAGRPILGQIDSFGLTNLMVIVVRYFGGTKLGVPGLINAYKMATIDALETATVVEKIIKDHYQLQFGYDLMSSVMGFLKNSEVDILSQDFEERVAMTIAIQKSKAKDRLDQLEAIVNPYQQLEESPVQVKAV